MGRRKKKRFKLYSGDGGGCFGIGPAYLNAYTERVHEFDAFIGTSIHAAMCAGYALGFSGKRVYEFMTDELPRIFHRPWYSWRRFIPTGPKHGDDALNRALKSFLVNPDGSPAKMHNAKKKLFITAMNFKHDIPKVFESSDAQDGELYMWEVVRCSVAASTYFSTWCPYHDDAYGDFFADGGLWANTPSCVGLASATEKLGVKLDDIDVMSVGTGYTDTPDRQKWVVDNLGKLGMIMPLLTSMFDGGNERAMTKMTRAFIDGSLQRFNEVMLEKSWAMDDYALMDEVLKRTRRHEMEYGYALEECLSG